MYFTTFLFFMYVLYVLCHMIVLYVLDDIYCTVCTACTACTVPYVLYCMYYVYLTICILYRIILHFRLAHIQDLSRGHQLIAAILKFLSYCLKLKVNRQYAIQPQLNTLNILLGVLNKVSVWIWYVCGT